MRAVTVTGSGDISVLRVSEIDKPLPMPGEMLIRVKACGVNRPDILQRKGFYPPPEGASPIMGLEIAGIVEMAPEDSAFDVGDHVMALLPGGGYAEYAIVDARHAIPLPESMSFVEGAGLPETLFTVWANVFEGAHAQPGESLFVHGATSGIGTMATTLAKIHNIEIYGTAGSAHKCAFAEQHGMKRCFNYREDDWSREMQQLGGADIVLDMVGGDYVEKNLTFLRPGGRHVSIAFQKGMDAKVNIMAIMQKQLTLTGSTLRSRSADEKARLTSEIRRQLGEALENGTIKPLIDKTFPLEQVAEAHAHMESGEIAGKVILTL